MDLDHIVEGKGKCLVCGDVLDGDIVVCKSCSTPTHKGCLDYAEGCPVYGCAEMSKPMAEALLDAEPEQQQAVYQSYLGRIRGAASKGWKILNTPITMPAIKELFVSEAHNAPLKALPIYKFAIEEYDECFRIYGVHYEDEICTFDLNKNYFGNGKYYYLNDLVIESKKEYEQGGFPAASMRKLHAICETLYENRNHQNLKFKIQIETARKRLNSLLSDNWNIFWNITLTKTVYEPNGLDSIVQDVGLPDEKTIHVNVVGPDEWITNAKTSSLYSALTGCDNSQKINDVYSWITGRNVYLHRFNSKPSQRTERGVGFDGYFYYFYLSCYFISDWRALGV